MYSLDPGYRIPALQRGLSPVESALTKANVGVGSAVLASAMISPPPIWTFGLIGAAAAVLNMAPGPRSIGRWAAVGYRHLRERTAPAAMTEQAGTTATWTLYPSHGTMQDPARRVAFHDAVARALQFASGQARSGGIQVHVTHHAAVTDATTHTQTVSVHVPKAVGPGDRILETVAGELATLGALALAPAEPMPAPAVVERGPGWVGLDTGEYAATARITEWPDTASGDLMLRVLLGDGREQRGDRSFAVLYRPLPVAQSHRAARWQAAAGEAFSTDKIKATAREIASETAHGALVQGATLVDLDAYMTVWGDTPGAVTDARWQASLAADRHRIRLDWLPGQQHRAHVMTTPHGASTRKGAIL
ncbi:hypothetical protein [Streptomyces sp. NPDC001068]|uniref:hypothetical protein n=1 Tax=Streptomyces sp. NPDC001068 TaxID=3364544 RepID=UPI00369BEE76